MLYTAGAFFLVCFFKYPAALVNEFFAALSAADILPQDRSQLCTRITRRSTTAGTRRITRNVPAVPETCGRELYEWTETLEKNIMDAVKRIGSIVLREKQRVISQSAPRITD